MVQFSHVRLLMLKAERSGPVNGVGLKNPYVSLVRMVKLKYVLFVVISRICITTGSVGGSPNAVKWLAVAVSD